MCIASTTRVAGRRRWLEADRIGWSFRKDIGRVTPPFTRSNLKNDGRPHAFEDDAFPRAELDGGRL